MDKPVVLVVHKSTGIHKPKNMNLNSLFIVGLTLLLFSCTPTYMVVFSAGEGGSVSTPGGEFDEGTSVSVTAQPNPEYEFERWSDGSIQNPRTIIVSQVTVLTASFVKKQYEFTVNVQGEGTVKEDVLIQGSKLNSGSQVKLTALPASGWYFDSWTGSVSGNVNPLSVDINGSKTITAVFKRKKYDLNVTIEGEGTVTEQVVVQPGRYDFETQVKLTATPEEGWIFSGWTGDIESTENLVIVTINGIIQITVKFTKKESVSIIDFGNSGVYYHKSLIYDDNIIYAGRYRGSKGEGVLSGLTSNASTAGSIFIMSTDLDGNINWVNSISQNYVSSNLTDLFVDQNGIVIIGSINPDQVNGKRVGFISNFDLDGNNVWSKEITSDNPEPKISLMEGITYDSNSDNYLFLATVNTSGFPFDQYVYDHNNNYWIIQVGSNGELKPPIKINSPEKGLTETRLRMIGGIVELKGVNEGRFLMISSGYDISIIPYKSGMWLVEFDSNFNEVNRSFFEYQSHYNSGDYSNRKRIIPLEDGGYLLFINDDPNNNYLSILRRYDSSFNKMWEVKDYGTGNTVDIKVDDNSIYTSGYASTEYFFSKKYNLVDGSLNWLWRTAQSISYSWLGNVNIIQDKIYLTGKTYKHASDEIFENNFSGDGEHLIIIRLDKESGELEGYSCGCTIKY